MTVVLAARPGDAMFNQLGATRIYGCACFQFLAKRNQRFKAPCTRLALALVLFLSSSLGCPISPALCICLHRACSIQRFFLPARPLRRRNVNQCEREGATAWRGALALADERDASSLPPDDLYSEAAAAVVQQAAAAGAADAVEAASTRGCKKREGKTNGGGGGGGGGGRRAGRVRASAGATATAAVDQRAEAASAE